MLRFCVDQWYKNKDKLESIIAADKNINSCDYSYLVKLIVKHILNSENDTVYKFNAEEITTIDHGDYQGTLLFLIPRDTYQPGSQDYLLTYIWYGSCSVCDTLLDIQSFAYEKLPVETQIKDYMMLCKDLVCNIVKPYKTYNESIFEEV